MRGDKLDYAQAIEYASRKAKTVIIYMKTNKPNVKMVVVSVCLLHVGLSSASMSLMNAETLSQQGSSSDPRSNSDLLTGADPVARDHYNRHYTMEELRPLYQRWTMVSDDHQKLALSSVAKLNEENIQGDIVECGVWKGGMTMAMMFQNMRDNTDRHFWLFDTFEGLPPPTEHDGKKAINTYKMVQAGDEKTVNKQMRHRMEDGGWNKGSLEVVKSNLFYTHYPRENIHFIKGLVEDTLPKVKLPEKIAILRLDTDFYESTKIELEYLWDRLVPGGILLVDDFCSWAGSKKAVTEFFKDKLGLDAEGIAKNKPCMYYWKKEEDKQKRVAAV